ncbi:Ion channel, partial [Trichostrongylus colubriformis]
MVLSVWDQNWTWLESFYFFFISLSTVGLGDLVPSSPRLLITMFGFILVGLSLVSMVINLLQTKMKKTYDAGRDIHNGSIVEPVLGSTVEPVLLTPEKHCCADDPMSESLSRSTQTNLSLPGVRQVVLRSDGVHWINEEASLKSPDEVGPFHIKIS